MRVIIAALIKIVVESDFKSVKKKFLNQGIDEKIIENIFLDFKELKNKQRIKKPEEKNIDYWGKKEFSELKNFIFELKSTKSKTQETKIKKAKGAKLIGENDSWYIYEITSHDSACFYGSGTKWCITERDGKNWNRYIEFNDFYYLIGKDRQPEDPLFKVAININHKTKKAEWWDANDNHPSSKKMKEIKRTLPTEIKYKLSKEGLKS